MLNILDFTEDNPTGTEDVSENGQTSSDVLRLDVEDKLGLTVQSFIGQRTAILGSSGGGKTNTLALILEKVLPFMPTVIFDQHDEYWGLCEQYEILRVGKSEMSQIKAGPEQAAQIAEISHSKRMSVLVEMLDMSRADRQDFVEFYCAHIWELNKRSKLPYGIVLEEAQNFIPEGRTTPAQEMMKQFALEGRKFGFSIFLSTQRSAEVSKTILAQCGLAFLHGVDIYPDVQAYAGMLPFTAAETKKIALNLGVGQCIVKIKHDGPARFLHPVKMLKPETFHVGDTPTLDEEAPPLRAIDGDLLLELQQILAPPKAIVGDKPFVPAPDAHVDSYIKDLRVKLGAANAAIMKLKETAHDPDKDHIRHVMAIVANAAKNSSEIDFQPEKPSVNVDAHKTALPSDEWDGRSELSTSRARAKQKRDFDGLLLTIRDQKIIHRRILVFLTQREGQAFSERELARFLGYSLTSIQRGGYPIGLINRKLIQRGLTAKRNEYTFQSTVREKLLELCPDLDIEPMVEQIKKLEKI